MNTSLTAYTNLESLLLFQSLSYYGTTNQSFVKISDLLKSIPSITADKKFQSGRLSPDALRTFYLALLNDEWRSELHNGIRDTDGQNGDVRSSRKRKAPSPTLPTVQEAAQHAHLIPKLVEKLYARYRTAISLEIRDDEDRYERLQKELQSIERGDRDNDLVDRANGKSPTSRSPSLPRKSPLVQQRPLPQSPRPHPTSQESTKVPTPISHQPDVSGGLAQDPQNGQARVDHNAKSIPKPSSLPQPFPGNPQAPNQSHPPPHPQPTAILPSPARPHTQFQPGQTFPGGGAPQYGPVSPSPQSLSSPRNPIQYPPTGFAPGPQSPGVQTPQHQRHLYTYPGQSHYVPPQAGQPPPQGGFMLPPFQVSPQDPSRAHQPMTPQYPHVSTPVGRQISPLTKVASSASSSQHPLQQFSHQAYPPRGSFSTPSNLRTSISAASTPRSAKTVWKASVIKSSGGPPPPRPEYLPIDDIEPLDQSKQALTKGKTSRRSRTKSKAKEKDPEPDPDPEEPIPQIEERPPEAEPRQGRSRRKAALKKARPGSVTSSQAGASVRERSRSQSVISHTETVAADNESQTGTHVKSERGASIDVIEEDPLETPTQPMTRRRGGNVQALQTRSRKRTAREASLPESEDQPGTPGLPKVVVAPRHFSRMCVPIMNDIGSDKHASLFSTAVRAKDAEGYYDIIKRPTDLKTIQKAVAVGAKTVAAAAVDTPTGSPGGGGGIVELPISSEVTPPKAIVNSAQLEKELMRMFVNAVMFNAGEEGVVEDARHMFEDCQQKISNWRNAERSTGRLEAEETPPVMDEEILTVSKRRKL
ncbi:Bromodomain-containing protein [Dendryphion nanum]|uniref:Bromodomain-containing protein n=1 Tax=Dendryphion nanum TaxID=256645 RepID=A0A9P9IF49_9PLEO|nr:Bromodomain-containing protein [Dendryphion nanum]